jgi:GTP1/Obg family GTP-binding protein
LSCPAHPVQLRHQPPFPLSQTIHLQSLSALSFMLDLILFELDYRNRAGKKLEFDKKKVIELDEK